MNHDNPFIGKSVAVTGKLKIYTRDGIKARLLKLGAKPVSKVSSKTLQLKPIDRDGKAITRKPRKSCNGDWCFSIDNSYTNTFHKAAVAAD